MSNNSSAVAEPIELTDRQQEVLDCLKNGIAQNGYVPTVREIGSALGINSPNGVMCHLKALEKKGCIQRTEHLARAIKILVD